MPDPFVRLALALAVGLLIGVERGWNARSLGEGERAAGLRTYTLTGLLGGLAAALVPVLGGWAFAALAIPFAIAFILYKWREQRADNDVSVTDVVAALIVFALGAYAMVGDWRVAAAAAVATAALLAFKPLTHAWLNRLTWAELTSALTLLAMTFIVLPTLPDRAFGPYGAVNPYQLWLLTIGLAGVSFLAYATVKAFGPTKGLVLGSAVGALISSTAVTLHLARLQKSRRMDAAAPAGAALIAGAVMACRILAIAVVLAPGLSPRLAPPIVIFAASTALIGWLGIRRGGEGDPAIVNLEQPFDLKAVLKLGFAFGAVYAAATVLSALYGPGGVLPLAALAGLVDADAATLAVARLTSGGLDLEVAAGAILLAGGVDSLSKVVIATLAGGRRFGLRFGAPTAIGVLLAAVVWLQQP